MLLGTDFNENFMSVSSSVRPFVRPSVCLQKKFP